MTWTAIWSKTAKTCLNKLPREDQSRILLKVRDVEKEPFAYLEKIAGTRLFRFRAGSYRIMVSVINDGLMLHTVKVTKRSRAYQ